MAYLVEADLYKLIYKENIDEIKRDNTTAVPDAIDSAISFAKSYLSRFDLLALFGAGATAPTVTDKNLKSKVIAVACYEIAKLGNPNVNLEAFRMYYEDAEAWFKSVQKGHSDPDGWILKPENTETGTQPGQTVTWKSNTKRDDSY